MASYSHRRSRSKRLRQSPENEAKNELSAELLGLLARQAKGTAEWEKLRDDLLKNAMPLAMWFVERRVFRADVDRSSSEYLDHVKDFEQSAREGILKAIDEALADTDNEIPFSDYVANNVFRNINEHRDNAWYINIPTGAKKQSRKIRRSIYPLYSRLQRLPLLEEVAEDTGLHTVEVEKILRLLPDHYHQHVANWPDKLLSTDAFGTLRNHDGKLTPEQKILLPHLELLSERDKNILLLHYLNAPENEVEQRRAAMAEKYKLTIAGVKNITTRLLREMQEAYPDTPIRGYTPKRKRKPTTTTRDATSDAPAEPSATLTAEAAPQTTPQAYRYTGENLGDLARTKLGAPVPQSNSPTRPVAEGPKPNTTEVSSNSSVPPELAPDNGAQPRPPRLYRFTLGPVRRQPKKQEPPSNTRQPQPYSRSDADIPHAKTRVRTTEERREGTNKQSDSAPAGTAPTEASGPPPSPPQGLETNTRTRCSWIKGIAISVSTAISLVAGGVLVVSAGPGIADAPTAPAHRPTKQPSGSTPAATPKIPAATIFPGVGQGPGRIAVSAMRTNDTLSIYLCASNVSAGTLEVSLVEQRDRSSSKNKVLLALHHEGEVGCLSRPAAVKGQKGTFLLTLKKPESGEIAVNPEYDELSAADAENFRKFSGQCEPTIVRPTSGVNRSTLLNNLQYFDSHASKIRHPC